MSRHRNPRASDARFWLTQRDIDEATKRHDDDEHDEHDEHDWAIIMATPARQDEIVDVVGEAQQRQLDDEHDWAMWSGAPGVYGDLCQDEFVDVVGDGCAVEGAGSAKWVGGLGGRGRIQRKRGPPSCVPPGRMTWYDAEVDPCPAGPRKVDVRRETKYRQWRRTERKRITETREKTNAQVPALSPNEA